MVESLIDRAVKSENNMKKPSSNEKVISDLKIDENVIYLQELDSDSWSKLIKVQDIVNVDIENILHTYIEKNKDIFVPDVIRNKLHNIKRDMKYAWHDNDNKFDVEYNLNSYNQIHELYIPTGKEYLDDIVIAEIYNSEGDFVADEIEENISIPLYKIESTGLYTDNSNMTPVQLYSKEKISFKDKLNNTNPDLDSFLSVYPIALFITVLPYLSYLYTNQIGVSIAVAVILTLMWFAYPICLYISIILPYDLLQVANRYYLQKQNTVYKSLMN